MRVGEAGRRMRREGWLGDGLAGCLLLILGSGLLTGCGKFFQPVSTGAGSSSGTGSGSGSSLDSVYVVNSNPSLDDVAAFSLTNGVLKVLPNSPSVALATGTTPSSLAINKTGSLVWAGSQLGDIYVFVVNSDGSLTLGNVSSNASQPVTVNPAAFMTVDPSGNYLLAIADTLSGTNGTSAPSLYVYSIDQTNGTLTAVANTPITLDVGTASGITFAPNGTQLFAALGTGGVDILTFAPSSGAASLAGHLNVLGNSSSDNGLTVDPQSAYLFVAETGTNGVRVLSISANNALSEIAGSPYITADNAGNQQLGARSVLVDKTGAYVYAANATSNTISAWTLNASSGALTEVAGSPFAAGLVPSSLAEDSGSGYLLVANAGGTPDLQAFSIAPSTAAVPGALTSVSTASTGTSSAEPAVASAVAATP